MKFLSLRTVYRVFPIIKHSKTFGPRLVPTPCPIDLKCQAYLRLITDYDPAKFHWDWLRNKGEIERRRSAVKKNKKEEKNNNNTKQNKNRKVCWLRQADLNKKYNKDYNYNQTRTRNIAAKMETNYNYQETESYICTDSELSVLLSVALLDCTSWLHLHT